jgi:hypothetical protein
MKEEKSRSHPEWLMPLIPLLLVGAGAAVIFGGDLFHGSDLFFKAIRDPNPFVGSYAWQEYHHSALVEGRFPLWNPWNGMGTPQIANYQSGFFSPLIAPLFLFPLSLVAVPYLLLRLVLAGWGMSLYLHRLGLSPGSCAMGALAFGLSGWMIQYVNNQTLVIDLLIPFILVFLERVREEKRIRDTLVLLALLCLVLVGGQPGSALFTITFAGAYALFFTWRDGKILAIFAMTGGIAFVLSLVQLFPFFELMPQGWSYHLPGFGLQHLHLSEIITLVAPGFYGFTSDNRIAIMQQLPYLGVIPVVLCLMCALHFRAMPGQVKFFLLAILVCLGFLHGLPGFFQVMSIPGLNRLSFFKYLQPLLAFSAAACAACALERIRTPSRSIMFLASGAILFLLWQVNRFPDARLFPLATTGLVLIQLAAFRLLFRRRWAVVFLALLGLILDSRFNHPNFFFNPEKHDYSFLKPFASRPPQFFRTAATPAVFAPNHGIREEVSDLRLAEVLFVRRYIEFLKALNKQTDKDMQEYILAYNYTRVRPDPVYFRGELAKRAGVRWFLSRSPLPPNRTIQSILAGGSMLAPDRDHILRSQFEIEGDSRPVLFQHPPSWISITVKQGFADSRISAAAGLDPRALHKPGDGMWFECASEGGLIYSRYLDPRTREDERRWVPVEVVPGLRHELRFITLPGADPFNDWGGWGDLRLDESPGMPGRTYQGVRVYENESAFPRAYFARKVRWVKDASMSRSLLFSGIREGDGVLLEGQVRTQVEEYPSGELSWLSMKEELLSLELDAEGDGALILGQTYFPGWQARLDGREARIYPADHVFQGILVPRGEHHLELVYRPYAFRIGLWTSIISLFCWLAIWPVSRFTLKI